MTTPTPTLRHPKTGLYQSVEELASVWEQTRGAIGRGVGDGLWFRFDEPMWRFLHMLGVDEPVVALFVVDGVVSKRATLRPWVGAAVGQADTILELPADCDLADEIEPGDEVVVG
jgi:uncharacterized membrane protein (UPF0127 family)